LEPKACPETTIEARCYIPVQSGGITDKMPTIVRFYSIGRREDTSSVLTYTEAANNNLTEASVLSERAEKTWPN
jgi:hypothetical protein